MIDRIYSLCHKTMWQKGLGRETLACSPAAFTSFEMLIGHFVQLTRAFIKTKFINIPWRMRPSKIRNCAKGCSTTVYIYVYVFQVQTDESCRIIINRHYYYFIFFFFHVLIGVGFHAKIMCYNQLLGISRLINIIAAEYIYMKKTKQKSLKS